MKSLKLFYLAVLLLIPFTLFGQPVDGTNNYTAKNQSPSVTTNFLPPNPVRCNDPFTDEYGETSNNTFLGVSSTNGSYVAVPDDGSLYNLTSGGTIEAWVMPTASTSSAPGIVAKGETSTVSFILGRSSSSSLLYFRIGGAPLTNTGGTTVPLSVWSHVAVTWTGTPGNYTVTFYVNGAISGAAAVCTGTFSPTTTDSLTIGITKPFTGNKFDGYIDEVKIWNTVRTQTQIAQSRFVGIGDFASANTGNAITSADNYTGLISSWTFNNHYRDDIGGKLGYARNSAGLYWFAYTAGYPMPYNFALCCTAAAGANDYAVIPENAVFDQTTSGTFEAWIYLNAAGVLQPIFQKGSSFATTTLAAYVTAGNKFGINIGAHNYFPSSSPATLVANRWYHVAATWSGGPNFTVNTYVNGQLDFTATNNLAMPTVSGPAWIGRYYGAQRFNGYIDEVRYWAGARTGDEIKSGMFASCRALLPNANLKGAWNFDGNLKNFSATSGIDASFNSGGTNNLRLSAYKNEATTGPAPNVVYEAFPTVLNCAGYPLGFSKSVMNTEIPDNASVTDTIKTNGFVGTLSDIQVFLAIQHAKTSDLTIKLKAPNSTEVILSAAQGGTSPNGYLAVFDDSTGNLITSTIYLSPWTQFVKPQNAMGTFGGTTLNGNWVLTVADGAATNTGRILGWGLRFNNSVIVGQNNISKNVPEKYKLYQNYPNPFNPKTNIKFDLPANTFVKLKIYNILGAEVATLVNKAMREGTYVTEWDASSFASGTYFVKLETGSYSSVKKIILLK
ncbi:MAG: T9SS type A sorting domain-containing protein [Ignavibacteria bacterium]|nr:T9SS type A sorting domain-containing protein [Ignavibacteria bacterium]